MTIVKWNKTARSKTDFITAINPRMKPLEIVSKLSNPIRVPKALR